MEPLPEAEKNQNDSQMAAQTVPIFSLTLSAAWLIKQKKADEGGNRRQLNGFAGAMFKQSAFIPK